MTFLAGDVGGTKTVLALVDNGKIVEQETFASAQFPGLASIAKQFLSGKPQTVTRACFGVAGPVLDDVCQATNLPWRIEARILERDLKLPRVSLVNDFQAMAIGISGLPPADYRILNDVPSDPRGPWVVIGAGTGLGEAVVIHSPLGYEVLASEGGHADFAPRNDLEIDLLRFMLKRHARVSYERIVSGPGLLALYDFFCEKKPGAISTKVESEIKASADPAAVISAHALSGDDHLCTQALELMVSIYGAEAGNLALKVVARGGVFVAGGIAPKILPKLVDGAFLKAFLNKGRLSPLLEQTPVKIVLNVHAGLIGAASLAAKQTL